MNRNEAVKACKASKSNVFDLAKYRHLKATYNIPNSEKLFSKFKKPYKATSGKIKTDKERVAEIQKQNNNYRDR